MNDKIEHAIFKLTRNVERHKKHDLIQFKNNILKINDNRSELWGTLLYVIFIIIVPIGFLTYEILYKNDYLTIGLLILCISIFIFQLKKIILGGNTLKINIKEKYFVIENNHILFKNILKSRKIDFEEVAKSELIEKTIKHKFNTSKWLRLSIKDKKGKKYILTDFENNYPENSIAQDVKNVLEASISQNVNYK
ncbi:MAG: hypothetical protein LCH35_11095 [Bacteroidetes bacterium]|uniref:hypothetical protein n=1 Tax=Flavobacterium sp. TaxID=239 RepID=UPI002FDB595A|nr:hypothetical protein [Bacteroidota bacterium]